MRTPWILRPLESRDVIDRDVIDRDVIGRDVIGRDVIGRDVMRNGRDSRDLTPRDVIGGLIRRDAGVGTRPAGTRSRRRRTWVYPN